MVKRGVRAQVSMEYLMVVAFVFIMMVPFFVYFLTQSQSSVNQIDTAQLSRIAREISDNAEKVYAFGAPTTLTLKFYLPPHVQSVFINGTQIGFSFISNNGAVSTLFESSPMNVSGNFSVTEGIHKVRLQAASQSVLISEVS